MPMGKRDLHRFRDKEDFAEQAQVLIEAGQIVAQQGNLDEARRLLQAALQSDSECAEAWLGLAWLAEDRQKREVYLHRVLELEPGHIKAQEELDRLNWQQHSPSKPAIQGLSRLRPWAIGLMILSAGLMLAALLVWGPVDASLAWLVATATPTVTPTPTLTPAQIAAQFEPQLQTALSDENWERALEIAAIMRGVDASGEDVGRWALETYMQCGQAMVQTGQTKEAQVHFDEAVALAPDNAAARLWQGTTQLYLEGQAAFEAGQWEFAVESFRQAHEQMPNYGDVAVRLAEAYLGQGKAALGAEDWLLAVDALTEARERMPGNPYATDLLSFAYRGQAQAAMDEGDWTAAIEILTEADDQLPEDQDIPGLLASAHRERGIAYQEQGSLQKARADLEAALALQPEDAVAQTHLDQVMYILFPPKRIEIDISRQRFYAWLGDTLIYSFPTSTGLPGRDTAAGHYKVLDKIPMAYSSIWRLQMPYWLGIYYVGSVENGIHALPIRPDGSVMWGGLLGQRASYGCVILSTAAARTIYNWAEIGTPVHIHY